MSLADIYQPVVSDLKKVEVELTKIAEVEIPLLAQLLEYSVKNGGKRVRPAFTLLSGKFYNYNLEKLIPMAAGVELLHGATLVHDDIVDDSTLRRNKPTICRKWGENAALLLGDYLFAKAGSLVAGTGNLRVIKLFAHTLMTISGGELAQINIVFDEKRALEHYYKWISAKTACLFSTSTESGAILSDAPEEVIQALKNYGYYFGMAFQVIDDVLDFTGTQSELGKPIGSDLIEGAVTLPLVIFAGSEAGRRLLSNVIENKKIDMVPAIIEKIKKSSVIERCVIFAQDFSVKACKAIENLPDNNARQSLIELATFVVKRRK
jgi:heptaprenyl diphosphate synthase